MAGEQAWESATVDVKTTRGLARAHLDVPGSRTGSPGGEGAGRPVGRLLLGHGAGGGVEAPDLLAARQAAMTAGWAVGRIEQPWRVAGKRVAALPPHLDVGWLEVVAALVSGAAFGPGTPLVLGGRSAGARVACRTSRVLAADGVLCLAFPLHPPGRPERSRAGELVDDRPVLVVQGERDAFGGPQDVRAVAPSAVTVVGVVGDHSLRSDRVAVQAAVTAFLELVRRRSLLRQPH